MMPHSILVVDDDNDVRKMVCMILSVEGYDATGAADGLEALEQLRSRPLPALVIVDLMMPRMDGNEFIRAMKSDPALARIPVAVISGHAMTATEEVGPPVVARLVKPIELDHLLGVAELAAGIPPSPYNAEPATTSLHP
jgi:CheY-like chemotaxis protein